MQKILNAGIFTGIIFLSSCGASSKQDKPDLAEKKIQLSKLKAQQDKLSTDIQVLENEIIKLDPSLGLKPKLVNITTLSTDNFTHYIDLQGKISTRNIYFVAPRGQGGQVRAVYVKEGDHVKKGQLILKLDDGV